MTSFVDVAESNLNKMIELLSDDRMVKIVEAENIDLDKIIFDLKRIKKTYECKLEEGFDSPFRIFY